MAGASVELVAKQLMLRRLAAGPGLESSRGLAKPYGEAEPSRAGGAGILTVTGLAGAVLGRRRRVVSALAGASLLAASALTRYGVFEAGLASARDPKYTIVPQRAAAELRYAAGPPLAGTRVSTSLVPRTQLPRKPVITDHCLLSRPTQLTLAARSLHS